MLDNKKINELFGIKESFELPKKLLSILLNREERIKLFDAFMSEGIKVEEDVFRDYFQEEHANRGDLKQDYTPDCLCKLMSMLQPETDNLLDICSGAGSLTIASKPRKYYQLEEYSSRSIPILLFNLAIRGYNASVIQKDVLTQEVEHMYELTNEGTYSDIREVGRVEIRQFDAIVSNPPYSLPWQPMFDERFFGYELAPKAKADYAFILDGLYRLSEDGTALYILPHGVLFRGQAEGKIRRALIDNNYIDAVIGIPENLFLNTSIPTVILVLKKNRPTTDILFIDASKGFVKERKQNRMTDEHIERIVKAYQERKNIDKFCSNVELYEVLDNEFNLNIPRYVDTFEPEPLPDLEKLSQEMSELNQDIKDVSQKIKSMMLELEGTTKKEHEYFQKGIAPFMKWLDE